MTLSAQLLDSLPSLRGCQFNLSKSSHRQLLADFSRILNRIVGNDAVLDSELGSAVVANKAELLSHYVNSNNNKGLLNQMQNVLLTPLINNINNAIQLCNDREKPRFVSLLSNIFTLPQLQALGCSISKQSFSSGNRHAVKHGHGAPVPKPHSVSLDRTLTDPERAALHAFLTEHSYEASNRCTKLNDTTTLPTRYVDSTYAELHRLWLTTHRNISQSYFRKCVRSFKVFKPPHLRGTDMCATCHKGKILLDRVSRRLATHQPRCSFRQFVENSILRHSPSATRSQSDLSQLIVDTSQFDSSIIPECRCSHAQPTSSESFRTLWFYFHHHALKTQSRFTYRESLQNLAADECLITIDWKENLSINRGPIEQTQHHYQRSLRSVLGCMLVYRDPASNTIKHHYIDLISESLSHDSISAYEQLELAVLSHLDKLSHIRSIHTWTDTGPHFRSEEFLCNVLFVLPQTLLNHGLAAEVNHHFFIESHGKSAVDGHFSHLSTWLNELCNNQYICTTRDLINGLERLAESHAPSKHVSVSFMHYQPACNSQCSHYQQSIAADVAVDQSSVATDGPAPMDLDGPAMATDGPVPMDIDDGNDVPVSASVEPVLDASALNERLNGEGRTRCTRASYYRHSLKLPKHSTKLFYHWKSNTPNIRFPNQQLASMVTASPAFNHRTQVSIACSVMPPFHSPLTTQLNNLSLGSSIETTASLAFASRLQPGNPHIGRNTQSVFTKRARHFASILNQA